MAVTINARGTSVSNFQIGKGGPTLTANGGNLELRDGQSVTILDSTNTWGATFQQTTTSFRLNKSGATTTFHIRDGLQTQFYNAANNEYVTFWNATLSFKTTFSTQDTWEIDGSIANMDLLGGANFRVQDGGNLVLLGPTSGSVAVSHDNTDLNVSGVGTTDINMTSGITAVNLPEITLTTALDETYGGTGQTTYATGDILYASGANTLTKLAAGTNTHVLTLAGGVPTWAAPATGTVTASTGADNRIAVFTSGTNIEGDANLTWNGTTFKIQGTAPKLEFEETDATADEGRWYFEIQSNQFTLRTLTDSGGSASDVMRVQRTGASVDSIALNGALTATSFGGITSGNLVDKSATEFITGDWTFDYDGGATNTDVAVLTLRTTSTGTPAAGFGPAIRFEAETTASNVEAGGYLSVVASDVTATSEDFDFKFELMSAGATATEAARITSTGSISLPEKADADADRAGYGQIWVNTATPNELYFTDDAGTDWLLNSAAGSGNVSNTGTPVNNQLAIWTDATTIEGNANLTWNGTTLAVTGVATVDNISIDGNTITTTGGNDLQLNAPTGQNVDLQYNGITRFVMDGANGRFVLADLSILIEERSAAGTDAANYGQIWVRNTTPNDLYYTDDTGQDVQITNNGVLAVSGYAAISGTPANNQIAVWTDATTIEGDANLTWDGTELVLGSTQTLRFADSLQDKILLYGSSGSGAPSTDSYIAIASSTVIHNTATGATFDFRHNNVSGFTIDNDEVWSNSTVQSNAGFQAQNTVTDRGFTGTFGFLDVNASHGRVGAYDWGLAAYQDFRIQGSTIDFLINTTEVMTLTSTALTASTLDADFDAITATSYGGITEANLLDKSATETVSGAYTFSAQSLFTAAGGGAKFEGTAPGPRWHETDAATDEGEWWIVADGGNLTIRAYNDAFSAYDLAMQITRTADNVDEINFYTDNGVERMSVETSGVIVTGTMAATTVTGANVTSGSNPGHTHTDISTITVADESADTTCFPLFVTAATGNLQPKTGSNITFNSLTGHFTATSKSFLIDHPTKEGKKLQYGSLEGPENGVYVRGRLTGNDTIELPDYWTALIDPNSITVNLTPIGQHQELYVADISDNKVVVGGSTDGMDFFYTVYAERVDVEKLPVEID